MIDMVVNCRFLNVMMDSVHLECYLMVRNITTIHDTLKAEFMCFIVLAFCLIYRIYQQEREN